MVFIISLSIKIILKTRTYNVASFNNSVVWWGTDAESSWQAVRDLEFVTGEFIWTGFDYLGETTPYTWPAKNSYFGIIDLAGFPKDIYYYYQSQWTTSPMVHILPHWNWPEAGKPGSEVPNPIPVWSIRIVMKLNYSAMINPKGNELSREMDQCI